VTPCVTGTSKQRCEGLPKYAMCICWDSSVRAAWPSTVHIHCLWRKVQWQLVDEYVGWHGEELTQ